ncbi:MAG: hypothetical protein KatS3mg008_1666 [Acidimicrobiales bacterium]|nr:MAG: hypothetical protein KatS3mg008_1666 [Acidimicrobiales bacterium]
MRAPRPVAGEGSRLRLAAAVLALAATALSGCGDGDGENEEGATTTRSDTGTGSEDRTTTTDSPQTTTSEQAADQTTTTKPTGSGGECDAPFVGRLARKADSGHEARELTDGDVTDTVAYPLSPSFVTIYASDRKIDTSAFEQFASGSFSTENALTAPTGGTLLTLSVGSLTSQTPLEKGFRAEFGPTLPSPIIDAGGGAGAITPNPEGTVEVLEIGDDGICVKVDYQDDLQEIRGTIFAPLWQG